MGLSDAQLGGARAGVHAHLHLTAPVFGAWGDRGSRTRPIAIGIFIWSLATVLSGLARTYPQLLAGRALVGIGEAAFVAIRRRMLADLFPARDRGRVYAVLNMAIPVGSALGFILGGQIGHHYGWRAAFLIAGAPGMALALAVLWLKDPPRGAQDAPRALPPWPARARWRCTWPAQAPCLTGWWCSATRPTRLRWADWLTGCPASSSACAGCRSARPQRFGEIVVVTGFLGTFIGGWVSDYLLRYSRQAYLWFSGVVTVLAAPAAYLALAAASREVYLPAIVVAELLLFMSTGPINAAIVNVVSPLERASAVALSMFMIHLLGDVPSPVLIGEISDHGGSLGRAVLIVPVAVLIGGVVWLFAAHVNGRAVAARA